MNKHDRKRLMRFAAIARMVEDINDEAAKEDASAAALAMRIGADGTEPFDLDDYPAAKARTADNDKPKKYLRMLNRAPK